MDDIVVTSTLRQRIEEFIGERRDTRILAAVVAALVVVALVVWANGRSSARVAPPARAAAAPARPESSAPASAPAILVHVAGAVRRPGLYELSSEARVADAIDAARGPKLVADLDALNLAQLLADGMKIYVPRRGEPLAQSEGAQAEGEAPLVSLNAADEAALESVPGIGPVKAAAIVEYRAAVGRFESVEQLLEVTGIGPATLEAIRPYVSL